MSECYNYGQPGLFGNPKCYLAALSDMDALQSSFLTRRRITPKLEGKS